MAKNKKNKMDPQSANSGDRMKHALNLELLTRMRSWPSVSYSETHSGAGIYEAELQDPRKQHIRNLRDLVTWERLNRLGNNSSLQSTAGEEFFKRLTEWWGNQENPFEKYPGSARQALDFLLSIGKKFKFRLTENDENAVRRLKSAMKPGKEHVEVKQASFRDEMVWLSEPDFLLLVVDPFKLFDSFDINDKQPQSDKESADDLPQNDIEPSENLSRKEIGFAYGHIDLATVKKFTETIEQKGSAVIHFWWPTSYQGLDTALKDAVGRGIKQSHEFFESWAGNDSNRQYHAFNDGHNHRSSLIGIGGGALIVKEVSELDWKSSWLSRYVKP
jgi:hypothetical protein